MSEPTFYLILDIETTGLDRKRDSILEIAWVILDSDLQHVSFDQAYIEPTTFTWEMLHKNPDVVAMHAQSGLLKDHAAGPKFPLRTALDELRTSLTRLPPGDVYLTGASVHFDRYFIEEKVGNMISDLISHRHLDVSAVKVMLQASGLELPAVEQIMTKHRALGDCFTVLEELRQIREAFQSLKLEKP